MAFDLDGARKAGYSDTEIVDHLAGPKKFNAGQARAAGYSDAELLQHLTGVAPKAEPAAALKPEDVPSIGKTLMIGAGRTFDKVLDGITQATMAVTGESDSTKAALKANVNEKSRLYKPLQDARPFATTAGETLPPLVIPAGGAATALGTTGKLALAGAIPSALEYGTVAERAKNAAGSAAGAVIGGQVVPKLAGLAGGGIGAAARALTGKVSPEVAVLYAKAQALGIPVNAAQLSDSKFMKTLASTVEHVPLSGAGNLRDTQQKAFNRAVAKTFGEDADKITRDVYDAARTRIGGEFERLSARNNLNVDPALIAGMTKISNRANKFATNDTAKAVDNIINELTGKMALFSPGKAVNAPASGGAGAIGGKFRTAVTPATSAAAPLPNSIPGATYQAIDSEISKLMRAGGEKSVYLGELQNTIRATMDSSISAADQEAWTLARSQYKNLKAVRDIVAKEGSEGNISPALLMGRLNATQAGKETMAKGSRGELGDIATIGKQFVRETIPNSGTVQRAMAIGLLGGGGMMAGMSPQDAAWLMASGATTGRVVNHMINTPASGARIMAPTARTLSSLLKEIPSKSAQVAGAGAGMTIADLMQR